ncbi:MAG: FkbM family methyltransferase [Cyanobacteria bacterium J06623_7]
MTTMTTKTKPKVILADYLKHLLIRTPLQQPAQKLQSLSQLRRQAQHPEMEEIWRESARIETILSRIIQPTDNCIDIGCHLGSMLDTILRFAPAGNHLAVEQTPYKAEWLRHKFPEVKILEFALGESAGEVTFYQNTNQSGFSGLRPHKQDGDRLLAYMIQAELLDNIVDLEQPIDFIKVDVEGGELGVLRGATQILRQYQPTILFECTQSGLDCFGYSQQGIFEFFQAFDYAIFLPKDFLDRGTALDLPQFKQAMTYPFQAFNFIAQPQSAQEQSSVSS